MGEAVFACPSEQARLIRTRRISPVELTAAQLDRIARFDGLIGAFVGVVEEAALDGAKKALSLVGRGDTELLKLLGLTFSVKDLIETAGVRTSMSSRAFAAHIPKSDAPSVRRLRDAGASLIGKTNTPEFGSLPVTDSVLNGVCRSPWNRKWTAGGSSGGAAAAVASGFCSVSLGSDGAGSIRIPAACCGVVGFKPSRGLVPTIQRTMNDSVVDGPLARTVVGAGMALNALSGRDVWRADDTNSRRLRIGLTTDPPIDVPVAEECKAAVHEAARQLDSMGHFVDVASPSWFWPEAVGHFRVVRQIIPVAYDDPDPSMVDPLNAGLIALAEKTSSAAYVRSVLALRAFAAKVLRTWEEYDLLLTPTLTSEPLPVDAITASSDASTAFETAAVFAAFLPLANITGQPAVSVPTHWKNDESPVGVQLIGSLGSDSRVLDVARELEVALPWAHRIPDLESSLG